MTLIIYIISRTANMSAIIAPIPPSEN